MVEHLSTQKIGGITESAWTAQTNLKDKTVSFKEYNKCMNDPVEDLDELQWKDDMFSGVRSVWLDAWRSLELFEALSGVLGRALMGAKQP